MSAVNVIKESKQTLEKSRPGIHAVWEHGTQEYGTGKDMCLINMGNSQIEDLSSEEFKSIH